ncbi:MAG: hypothetical protein E7638_06745 [Ruminococcaceae bacterium]|nr:hypothetical protein [Oscillospiraceae bacterium]
MNKPAPFTENQVRYFNRCFDSWFNIAEGGKRGGKNVLQTLAFCTMLDVHPNKLHLIAGVSQTAAKLNIIDCDGYGMTNFFEGKCREGRYKERSCLYVQTKTGEKVVLVSGGGKDGDEKYIKGNTYGMAYVTEANECHPHFIAEVFDRTLSSSDRKIFHDLNPKAPGHWYYSDIEAFHREMQAKDPLYGFNYGHFTIADNLSIDDSKLRRVLSTYQKGTVWYDRDILGERKLAEGLVYRFGEENIADEVPDGGEYYISVDYGTMNPFSAGLWCVNGRNAVRISEYYYSGRDEKETRTDEEYCDAVAALADGYKIKSVVVDPSAASFITALQRRGFPVLPAENEVKDGIRRVAVMLQYGYIRIHRECRNCIREFGMYRWDGKEKEDNVIKENDHAMDDVRYFCSTIMQHKVRLPEKAEDGMSAEQKWISSRKKAMLGGRDSTKKIYR